jgi:hypothetical protein
MPGGKLIQVLRPLANIYVIALVWVLTGINLYLFMKPLNDYAVSMGLANQPIVLDMMNYYTAEQGYQALSILGDGGRDAYRLSSYTDFVLPVLVFLAMFLPHLAQGQGARYVIGPSIYIISDYIENVAEKYVLELYPQRNDTVMRLACYAGLVKMIGLCVSLFLLVIHGLRWILTATSRSERKQRVKTQ